MMWLMVRPPIWIYTDEPPHLDLTLFPVLSIFWPLNPTVLRMAKTPQVLAILSAIGLSVRYLWRSNPYTNVQMQFNAN